MQSNGPEKDSSIWINYIYFGSLFALLIFLCTNSVLLRENFGGSKFFFLFYSFGEACLEVVLFILGGWLIRKFLPKIFFTFYMGFTFFCFLYHLTDFMLDRVLNLSVWETLQFVFDESFENFLTMLEASGLPLWTWFCFFGLIAAIPLFGIAIFRITEWIGTKKPLGIRLELLIQIFFCLPIALFFWDYSASRFLPQGAHPAFIKTLPWKFTFFRPEAQQYALPNLLAPLKPEAELLAASDAFSPVLEKRPNIYLIIAESLRDDFIRPEIAPHLSAFRDNNIQSELSLANANGTMISWFSIFHSNFPYYWSAVKQQGWQSGSPALQLLRKMGYEIRVYSSADLIYYGMDELLFGKNTHLVSSLQNFPHVAPKKTWQSDAETLDAFQRDLSDNSELNEGQCFVFFWDSTHFDYSWPKDKPPLFAPVASESNYFKAYQSKKNIEAIKNRYRNAVHYVDELFERFLTLVPNREEAVIIFTGDHGEEFFEHGHLFHLSQLSDVQTQVPIFMKLPRAPTQMPAMISHMDVFPTLIDAVTGQVNTTKDLLKGQSIYLERRWPYAVLARYNASRTPCEFCLHNGRNKMIARFSNQRDIFHSPSLKILSLRTCRDQVFCDHTGDLNSWMENEFGTALERLFPAQN